MKKILLLLAAILFEIIITPAQTVNSTEKLTPPSPLTIDQFDTTIFDISQAVYAGSYVEFPVYFNSDDFIYAFDFSFKYNQLNFLFDTIIDMTTYLLDNSYYNPNDSTIRFTSSSLTPIANNTPLVKIRFDTLSGQMCSNDINTILDYLNGQQWGSVKVIDCIALGISENKKDDNLFTVFPNPSDGMINVQFKKPVGETCSLKIEDITGKTVFENNFNDLTSNPFNLDLHFLPKGIYILRVISSSASYSRKLVLQ